jgi:hypothetical protein
MNEDSGEQSITMIATLKTTSQYTSTITTVGQGERFVMDRFRQSSPLS